MSRTKGLAAQGEMNRLLGNYSEAINCFSAEIEEPEASAHIEPAAAARRERRILWLRAHRGAAYGSMNAIEKASEDLKYAIEARKSPYPWALAQLGEAHRLYALSYMDKFSRVNRGTLWNHLDNALDYFDQAITHKPGDPWAHAHRGAAYANAYWFARRLPALDVGAVGEQPAHEKPDARDMASERPRTPERLADHRPNEAIRLARRDDRRNPETLARRAREDFGKAIELSPGYAWAHGFLAFQLVLEDRFGEAMAQLGTAQTFDVNLRMSSQMLRNMSKLWSYQKQYRQSVNAAWLALQKNQADLVSAYFLAVGLKKLNDPTAPLAIDQARRLLDTAQVGIDYMRGGLDKLEGKLSRENLEKFERALKEGDLEVKSIFFHDPTWDDQERKWREIFSK